MSPLEHVFLGIGNVMRNENILVDYPRRASQEIPAKPTCLEAEVTRPAPSNNAQPNNPPDTSEIVTKLDEFLTQKRRLLNAPFKKLSMKDKDQVSKWKEQETALTAGKLFCQEADVKTSLTDRGRTLFRSAIPCLRHVRRIKEVRIKGQVFFLPY
ncbi:hypothetical protein ANCCEY_09000 [Ancylostoma ceylanicum]|uniref:SKA complex subunit 1 n=1 Tax=Ancylostoma ceylanicum TaxID=53326 RepID=A0A0D6LIT8_9BILA|nr:hypothetical protein ANCCEY_09000 [Ancylostoma ceylanicum]